MTGRRVMPGAVVAQHDPAHAVTGYPGVAARWMMLGEWRAHPARLIVGALAIAVGVALGFAVHVVNRTALESFDRAVRSVNGAAELQVRAATPAGFAEELYPRIAGLAGVTALSPVVELAASAGTPAGTATAGGRDGRGGRLTLLGLDILRAVRVTPSLVGMPMAGGPGSDGRDASAPFDGDAVFVSRAALRLFAARIGDEVSITAAGVTRRLRIAGTLAGAGDDQALAVIDIADAQWRFGQVGRLQRIDLRLAPGVDRDAVRAAIGTMLPVDAALVSPENEAQRSDSLSRAYRVNLEMLAMVALLTGGFLVFSAQSLSVARRRPQFALLRVLGLTRAALVRQVVTEGAILGVVGAALGIGLGYALADLAVRLLGGDLGGGYFGQGAVRLAFPALAALAFAGIGVGVAVVSSLLPATAAGRAQPAVALKGGSEAADPRTQPPGWPGLLLLAAGGVAALGPPIWGLPLLGYLAMALLLAGGVAAMPWLTRRLLAQIVRVRVQRTVAIDLALQRLWGAPGQAAVALCGIVASTSLMVAMAVMVASFRTSVDAWLVQVLPSDVYLHVEGAEAGGLDRAAQARLAGAPGVATIRFVRQLPLRLAADKPAVMLVAQTIDAGAPGAALPLLGRSLPVPAGAVPVWVSEPMGWLYGVKPGDSMKLPLGDGARPVFVAGVWRDYARQFGAIAMATRDYAAATGDATVTEAAVMLAPGAAAGPVTAALRRRLPPGLVAQTRFAEPRQLRAMALKVFDRSFAITYALEAIAIGIGLIGVATTFSAQTLARRREFGMLRHIGVQRRQIIAMLAAEGALLGGVGVVAGLGLGVVMAQVLIHVVNPQSFHWTMDTSIPWGLFAGLAAALVAAAAGTAVLAGRRALSADAVNAVRQDW